MMNKALNFKRDDPHRLRRAAARFCRTDRVVDIRYMVSLLSAAAWFQFRIIATRPCP
ncbi:hypothetical protein DESC_370075 [Desulfosarcina cetonica]|nr:hypothetical protein DESC_370075 [Desulfosarcina cetonica]